MEVDQSIHFLIRNIDRDRYRHIKLTTEENHMGTVSPTTKISAFSAEQVSLLHDPELVEDFSDILNRSDRLSSKSPKGSGQVDAHGKGTGTHEEGEVEQDEEEKSNTGSVVITKGTSGSGHDRFSLQRASMFSSSSSRYSKSDTDTDIDAGGKDREDNTAKKGEEGETEAEAEADADADGMVTADEGDAIGEDGDGSRSNWNGKVDTSVRSDATEDITVTQIDNKDLDDSRDRNDSSETNEINNANKSDEVDNDDATLNLDYSDSEFEEGLGTRMQQLNSTDYRRDSNVSNDSNETSPKLLHHSRGDTSDGDVDLSSIDQGMDVECDEEEEFFDEDEEADLEAEFQPLPPPTELDPEKLYALYPFNGPDASHCQLEQDEPCILLNDQDVYWWLVKRCRDNKIGFAPAEILETFPERLARLNCWKNENMSSSSRDLTVINKVPDELVSEEEDEEGDQTREGDDKEDIDKDRDNKKSTSVEGKHTLKNYKKSGKSVSFNDIVSYADRYIEYSDVGDENSVIEEEEEEEEEKKRKKTNMENINGVSTLHRTTRHYDKFGEETLQFDDEEDNMSETLSETSFSTGFAQPLVLTKRRAAAHRANRDSFGSGHTRNGSNSSSGEASRPSSQESCYRASSEGEDSETEMGRSKKTSKGVGATGSASTDSDSDSEGIEETSDGHKPWDMMPTKRYRGVDVTSPVSGQDKNDNSNGNSGSSNYEDNNDDDDNPQKIFEAPTAPFLSKTGGMDASNSRNSVSTLGEFSPSSPEYTAADSDSPRKNLSVTPDVMITPHSPTSLPSSHAIQDIPMFLRASRPDGNSNANGNENETEDQTQEQAPEQESFDSKTTNKEENGDTTQISSESNYKVDDTLTKVCTQTSVTTVEELSMDPVIVATATDIGIPPDKLSTKTRLPLPGIADRDLKRVEVSHIDRLPSNGGYHPVIDKIYAPFFRQIDELISRIDRLLQN